MWGGDIQTTKTFLRQGRTMTTNVILAVLAAIHIASGCDVPIIQDEDFSFDVYENEQSRLTWRGEGYDNVTWSFIPAGTDRVYPYPFPDLGDTLILDSGRTLIITMTTSEARGVYMSVATCTHTGNTASINITLGVQSCMFALPTFSGTSNVSAVEGTEATLHCTVDFHCINDFSVSELIWKWNGTDIGSFNGTTISTNIGDGGTVHSSNLTIHEVLEVHFLHPFICEAVIQYDYREKEIFLIKRDKPTLVERKLLNPIPGILGAIYLITYLIIIGVVISCWPYIKWSVRKLHHDNSRGRRSGTENRQRRYDVFVYHNDDGNNEADDVYEYLSQNGYSVLRGINPGQAYTSVRQMIEDSSSVISIATSDEMLPSVLTETTEEIRIPIVIILTRVALNLDDSILNRVKLKYPYRENSCFSCRKSRFYTNLKLNLPIPRGSPCSAINSNSDHLEAPSIALLEHSSNDRCSDRVCENNSNETNFVV